MLKRREIFNLFSKGSKKEICILPPYNEDRSLFDKFCKECDKACIKACEDSSKLYQEGIIKEKEGMPYVDFTTRGCTLCQECAKVCEYDVLKVQENPNWNVKFSIDALKCLAYQKTMCFTCKDICQSITEKKDVILFTGMFYPVIEESCIGCGFCISACPTYAIIWS
ncbi:4Fe-4S binding protein [Helicobacter burdigaliensis]|uniref:4Fe-4S binding protein n=1 Tax=Helicobacter burdigaliensis TaxID=2315334 RepID=UPI001E3D6F12|nr:4Fe-4S binding protein [Helicobacter burdigaliensis]